MNAIKQILKSGAMLLALSLVFTSCDELIGELDNLAPSPVTPTPEPEPTAKTAGEISYAVTTVQKASHDQDLTLTNPLTLTGDGAVSYESSNPAVASVDATGMVTLTGTAGTTTIKAKVADTDAYTYATNEASYTLMVLDGYSYLKWDGTAQKLVSDIETNYQEVSSATTTWDDSKVLVVKDADVEITTNITLSGHTTIILCDGAKLTTKQIHGNSSYTLTIYGQSAQTGKFIAHPDNGGAITMIQELHVHGGDIEPIGGSTSNGVKLDGGTKTLNVYGGKLTARGGANGIYDCKTLNILGGTVEAYGGTNSGSGHYGIRMASFSDEKISVSNDGRLKVVGGDGTTEDGSSGFYGTLVARDNAVVEVYGGHADSGDHKGGYAISSGNVEIHDNASVTCIAGNSSGAKNGNPAIPNNVFYHGGTLIAIGGAKGDSDHNDGKGIGGTLTNSSGGTIYYATNTDGSNTTFPDIVTMLSTDPAKDFTSTSYRGIKVYK